MVHILLFGIIILKVLLEQVFASQKVQMILFGPIKRMLVLSQLRQFMIALYFHTLLRLLVPQSPPYGIEPFPTRSLALFGSLFGIGFSPRRISRKGAIMAMGFVFFAARMKRLLSTYLTIVVYGGWLLFMFVIS